jgi:hypothetical protein
MKSGEYPGNEEHHRRWRGTDASFWNHLKKLEESPLTPAERELARKDFKEVPGRDIPDSVMTLFKNWMIIPGGDK